MRNVKSRSGSLRAERAGVTRQRIESAARVLFTRQGYATTTLRELAAEADVAVQTVYAVYGTKGNVLRALIRSVVDDPEADAAAGEAIQAPTVEASLAAFARSIRRRWEAGHDVVRIHAEAASADPELRQEAAFALAARGRGIGTLAGHLVHIAPRLGDPRPVAAILDALTLPAIFEALTTGHGWTADAYEAWLQRTMSGAVGAPEAR